MALSLSGSMAVAVRQREGPPLKSFGQAPSVTSSWLQLGVPALGELWLLVQVLILIANANLKSSSLDLTIASHVHMIEPQWTPMAEDQAIGRLYRMGQTQEVVATRYVVKDSIEEVSAVEMYILTGKTYNHLI